MHLSDQQVASKPQITVFTSSTGALNKRFELVDGVVRKETRAIFSDGMAQTATAGSAEELLAIIRQLGPRQALSTGSLRHGTSAQITTKARAGYGAISRSKDNFTFPSAPGWLLVDYDDSTMPDEVRDKVADLGGPLEALLHIFPEARDAERLFIPSSSDGIIAPDGTAVQSNGSHLYVKMSDVSLTEITLKTLRERAWCVGLAWWMISKSGAMLERSIVDVSVGSPERLIFEAQPEIVAPLTRRHRDPVASAGRAVSIRANGGAAIKGAQAQRNADRAKREPEAQRVRSEYIEARAKAVAEESGVGIEEARKIIHDRVFSSVLFDFDVLTLSDGSSRVVHELLDEMQERHDSGQSISFQLPDPDEGADYSLTSAGFIWSAGFDTPTLVSHAHGIERTFSFARFMSEDELSQALGAGMDRSGGGVFTPDQVSSMDLHGGYTYRTPEEIEAQRQAEVRAAAEKLESTVVDFVGSVTKQVQANIEYTAGLKALGGGDEDGDEDSHADRERAAARRTLARRVRKEFGVEKVGTRSRWKHDASEPALLIRGAQGIGKTRVLVGSERQGIAGILHKARGLVVFVLCQSVKLAQQSRDNYEATRTPSSPPSRLYLGRSQPAPLDENRPEDFGDFMCLEHEKAEVTAKAGGNVLMDLCATCPHAEGKDGAKPCQWMQQKNSISAASAAHDAADHPDGMVLFTANTFAKLPSPGQLKPDLVVFDESMLGTMLESCSLKRDELGQPLDQYVRHNGDIMDKEDARLEFLHKHYHPVIRPLLKQLAQLAEQWSPRAMHQIRSDRRITAESLSGAISAMRKLRDPGDGIDDEEGAGTSLSRLIMLFEVICENLRAGGDEAVGWRWYEGNGVKLFLVDNIARLRHKNVPTVILDGTGDESLLEAVFGQVRAVEISAPRRAKIVQFIDRTFSTTSITGSGGDDDDSGRDRGAEALDLCRQIIWAANRTRRELITVTDENGNASTRQKRVLVTGSKGVIETLSAVSEAIGGGDGIQMRSSDEILEAAGVVDAATNGSFTGKNDWENFDAIFCIGQSQPPTHRLEGMGAAFHAYLGKGPVKAVEGVLPCEPIQIETKAGAEYFYSVSRHPEPIVEAVRWQACEALILQAMDRLRMLHGGYEKEVFLLNSLPTVTPDRVVSWDKFVAGGTPAELTLREYGCTPLHGAHGCFFAPRIWGDDDAAQQRARHEMPSDEFSIRRRFLDLAGVWPDIQIAAVYMTAKTRTGVAERCHLYAIRATGEASAMDVLKSAGVPVARVEMIPTPGYLTDEMKVQKAELDAWMAVEEEYQDEHNAWREGLSGDAQAVGEIALWTGFLTLSRRRAHELHSGSFGTQKVARRCIESFYSDKSAVCAVLREVGPNCSTAVTMQEKTLSSVMTAPRRKGPTSNSELEYRLKLKAPAYSRRSVEVSMFSNPENQKARAAFEEAASKAAGREVVIESDSVTEVIAYTPEAEDLLAAARSLIAAARPDADEAEILNAVFPATGVLAQAARLAPLAERWAQRAAEVDAAADPKHVAEDETSAGSVVVSLKDERAQRIEEREEEARRREWELRHPDGFEPSSLELKHFAELEQIRLDTLYSGLVDAEALGADAVEGELPVERSTVEIPAAIADVLAGRGLRLVVDNEQPSAGGENAAPASVGAPEPQKRGEMGDDRLGQGQAAPEVADAPELEPQGFAWERTPPRPSIRNPEPRKLYAWE